MSADLKSALDQYSQEHTEELCAFLANMLRKVGEDRAAMMVSEFARFYSRGKQHLKPTDAVPPS